MVSPNARWPAPLLHRHPPSLKGQCQDMLCRPSRTPSSAWVPLLTRDAPLSSPQQQSLSTILMDIPFLQVGASKLARASGTSRSPNTEQPPGCSLHHSTAGNHPVTTTACSASILRDSHAHTSSITHPSTILRHPLAHASSIAHASAITHPATCPATSQPRNPGHQLCGSGLCSLLRLRRSPGGSTCFQGHRDCL
jgi:hypothetical protein